MEPGSSFERYDRRNLKRKLYFKTEFTFRKQSSARELGVVNIFSPMVTVQQLIKELLHFIWAAIRIVMTTGLYDGGGMIKTMWEISISLRSWKVKSLCFL
jgi:hypothetical protein